MKRDDVRLSHMLEYARDALAFVEGKTKDDLKNDKMLAFAVTRAIEVIGEAANYVPANFRDEHPQILWRQIIGARNRLIHGYFAVDLDILWQVVTQNLPELIKELEQLVDGS